MAPKLLQSRVFATAESSLPMASLAAPPAQRALRRVVVTGVGCLSPLGGTVEATRERAP